MYSGPYPTIEQQIQIDAMLLRKSYEEQAQFRQIVSQLINRKSLEGFNQKRPLPVPKANCIDR